MRLNPILLLLILMLQGFIQISFVISPQKPGVVIVNLKTIKAEFIRQLAMRNATDEQVSRATKQFNNQLEKTLSLYSKEHPVVILKSESVLFGGNDVTGVITTKLSAAMRKKA